MTMENKLHDEFQERLCLLATTFIEELPDKINEIEGLWSKLLGEWESGMLQEIHRAVNNLAGSSKTFGFSELSIEARVLEQIFKNLLLQQVSADAFQANRISQQILELKKISEDKESNPIFIRQTIANKEAFFTIPQPSDLIFVVNADAEAAEELALQLRYYGYEVEVFNQLDKFRAAILQIPNAIVLMEIEFPDDEMAGIRVMEEVQRELTQPAQVIFISVHDGLDYRLGAVRAGGLAYFTKPFNPVELIGQLDLITASQIQDSFRILLVDDNPTILAYNAAVLERAGMTVKAVTGPSQLLETLNGFNPDLILMDLYMPGCNGIELAKVIRQMEGFIAIPIVYLSSENDFNTQREAMSLGGDDFLVKPVFSRQLISAVTLRVMRARSLRALMVHDGLTGLLNHAAIKEELVREVVRSDRLNTPLSFAMVDIDFIKKVNDLHGHAAGDRVVKSLARLLKQRLRGTDIVGRYGGEEFAVIMNDTDATSAAKVIDEIRHVFSRLLHLSQEEEFSVSFSCGIADLEHFPDAAKLSEAAEKALFHAKQRGRNKVVVNNGD